MSTCSDKGENTDNCFVLRERKMKVDKCVAESFILCDFCTRVEERDRQEWNKALHRIWFSLHNLDFSKVLITVQKKTRKPLKNKDLDSEIILWLFQSHEAVLRSEDDCWGEKGTVEKSQTSAINASLQMSRQGIWGYTNEDMHMRWGWKHCTEAKMATAQYNAFI